MRSNTYQIFKIKCLCNKHTPRSSAGRMSADDSFLLSEPHIIILYMKGPNPKSGICDDFVKVAFSLIEALKNIQIDKCSRYITVLQLNISFAFCTHITIDLKIVANSGFWILTLHIYRKLE